MPVHEAADQLYGLLLSLIETKDTYTSIKREGRKLIVKTTSGKQYTVTKNGVRKNRV